MTAIRDFMSLLAVGIIILVGHVATADDGRKDIADAISSIGKAINDLIRWINRQ